MQAIALATPGGPELLRPVELPTPTPGRGEVLVRVEHAGVNFVDVYHRTGLYPQPRPIRLGQEGAGIVEVAGEGAGLAPGARVAWAHVTGSYATHLVAPADRLVPIPDAVSTRTAAAVMLQGMTAHYLANDTFRLAKGQVAVVHAAAGGVGLLLTQLARRAGATVIGTVSTDAKAAQARTAGATEAVVYSQGDFAEAAKRLSGGAGAHVVYDSVGRDTFEKSITALRPRGLLVSYGQSSGPVPPIDPILFSLHGSLFFTRPRLGDYIATRDELLARAGAVLALVANGELNVSIDSSHPLAAAAAAHKRLESRKSIGKVLIDLV